MNPRKLGIFLQHSIGAYRPEPSSQHSWMESEWAVGKNVVAACGGALGPDGEIRAIAMAGPPCMCETLGMRQLLLGGSGASRIHQKALRNKYRDAFVV